jgi:hypothetical protein
MPNNFGMKKIVILLLISFPIIVVAQNVGIGTSTPTEKLEVKNPLKSTIKISAGNLLDTTQLILSNSGSPGFYTDFSIKSVREEGLFFSSRSDFPTYNSSNSLVIRPQGNVGIGTNLPAYRLQVHENAAANGYMNITNTTTGSSGTDGLLIGLTGNSAILANLENGSLQLGTNNLTRVMIDATGNVGIGNSLPAFKLDVSGDINITGLLRLNSTAGGAGQVLTSNGATDPTWQTINQNPAIGCVVGLTSNFTGSGYAMLPLDFESLGTTYFDDGNIFDPVNNNFTAPSLGVYHFDVSVDLDAPPVGLYSLNLVSSAAGTGFYAFSTTYVPVAGTGSATINLSVNLKMTAGSKMWVFLNRSTLVTVGNTSGTKFSAYRVY